MALTTATTISYALIGSLVMYVITIAYSVYMAVLNHKQAKVKDLIIEQNKILTKMLEVLKQNVRKY